MEIELSELEDMFHKKLALVEDSYDQEDLEIMEQCLVDVASLMHIADAEEKSKELDIIKATLANVEDKVRLRIAKIVEESVSQLIGFGIKTVLTAIRPI